MGAVNFSLDPNLVAKIQSYIPLTVLIETGTFKGDTVVALEPFFEEIVSIELSESLWRESVNRCGALSKVKILHGNSADLLSEYQTKLQNIATLYWLDAHWCIAENTAGELSQCPLLDELRAIKKLNSNSVILIDDARLFLSCPPEPHESSQWPTFNQVVMNLMQLSLDHELMVVNDVIAFYPKHIKHCMIEFAKDHGIDWLSAVHCFKESDTFFQQLKEKEAVIQEKEVVIQEKELVIYQRDILIGQKEKVIEELANALSAYRLAFRHIRFAFPALKRIINILRYFIDFFKPNLGNLLQHSPRSIAKGTFKNKIKKLSLTPKVSIVTPSYMQAQYIERTLLSVIDQNYPNIEYFVQDGGSKDGTVEILMRHEKKLSGWVSEPDMGQSNAINSGFNRTSGEIMGWLNSDDLLLPGALNHVVNYFNVHPDVDVVYGNRLLIDGRDMEVGRWILPGHDDKILSWVDFIPQETLFWRRSIWDKSGGRIDESFHFAMDWDLLLRFRKAGAKFGHIPQFIGAFRVHAQQKTSHKIHELGQQEMNRIRLGCFGYIPSQREIRKAISPFLIKHVFFDKFHAIKDRLRG